jgi:type III secretion system (T3SS) inner membrane Yop/YscD-like protein
MIGTATKLGDRIPLTTAGHLSLQIRGTSRAGQIIRLKSRKCSIGSGERCTLRVHGRSVKPLHCVIFRGQADTFIRSWAPDTRLNGQSFSDARLSPGDRIGVGSVEFEVLDPTDKRIYEDQTPNTSETTPAAKPRSADGTGTARRKDLDCLTSRLVLANQQGRARVRRLIGQLRLAKDDLLRLQQGSTSPSTDDRSACPADGQERQSSGAQPMDQQEASEEDHGQWKIARREAEQQLGGRAKELDEQMAQLEAQKAALHRQRNEWEASRAEAEEQLVVRAAQVDKREAELDGRLAELGNTPVAADVASSDSESANTVSQEGAPPTNEQTEDASGEATIADLPGASNSGPKQLIAASTDDESVAQYMARLLGRVRGVVRGQDADPKAETLESQPSVDAYGAVSDQPSG